MNIVLISTLMVVAIGLFVGLFLGISSNVFKVEVDEKELAIRNELPGNNCGGCGEAGCDALAAKIAKGEAASNACPVGGDPVAKKIAAILGTEATNTVRKVAFVKCDGNCLVAKPQYHYSGIQSCASAKVIGSSSKACQYGCMGLGDCIKACGFDALHLEKGIVKVDEDKCKACGKCVQACPNQLIELVPFDAQVRVACHSNDKGVDARKKCDASCIGCGVCQKTCPVGAITVEKNLASIDYDKCTHCGRCAVACPRKCINDSGK